MRNQIKLSEDTRTYKTEENLDKGLKKLGLYDYTGGEKTPMRFIKVCTPEGRWTAIFLVSEFFNVNGTGGYLCIASQHGFMSV